MGEGTGIRDRKKKQRSTQNRKLLASVLHAITTTWYIYKLPLVVQVGSYCSQLVTMTHVHKTHSPSARVRTRILLDRWQNNIAWSCLPVGSTLCTFTFTCHFYFLPEQFMFTIWPWSQRSRYFSSQMVSHRPNIKSGDKDTPVFYCPILNRQSKTSKRPVMSAENTLQQKILCGTCYGRRKC